MPSQSTPSVVVELLDWRGRRTSRSTPPPKLYAVPDCRRGLRYAPCILDPPRGERHALLPKPPERKSLARISLRARHPLLPNAELGTSTSLTAAASSRVSPPRALCGGFATAAKPRSYDPHQRQLYLARGEKVRLTNRKDTITTNAKTIVCQKETTSRPC